MNSKKINVRETLKYIPSIDEILIELPLNSVPQEFYKLHINRILSIVRKQIIDGEKISDIKNHCFNLIKKNNSIIKHNSLKQIINGTGIILHTGLGRAPIDKNVLISGIEKNYPYSNLEFNLNNGKRGDRNSHIKDLFNSLCKSEDTIIVNNNAAAVILMLNSICENKEVLISRGQLVEIGGSFRIPDIMLKSKCKMVEIGTTNKTHINDYENAITKNTAAILYVHTSNYKVVGFTNDIQISEISKISKKYNIPLLVDLGSGSIADFKSIGLSMEKIISNYIKQGSDVVAFSGDKLLGGPQAGIITGGKKYIKLIQQNSFYRAFRCDKIRISIMETILRTYYTKENINKSNLTIQLFKRKLNILNKMGNKIISALKDNDKYKVYLEKSFVEAGSGSLPTEKISSYSILIESKEYKAYQIYSNFLLASTPVVGYINNNIFRIDLKAIPEDQIPILISSIKKCLK
tara:strand:+ start:321 stop:1709 length:1389 start_codon:yes stop_codon:yes gene_type:complete